MPLYTYICKKCGEEFDLLVGVTSEKIDYKCKKCGSRRIERKLGTFSVGSSSERSSCSINGSCSTGMCPTNL